jgi:hypothetical protein
MMTSCEVQLSICPALVQHVNVIMDSSTTMDVGKEDKYRPPSFVFAVIVVAVVVVSVVVVAVVAVIVVVVSTFRQLTGLFSMILRGKFLITCIVQVVLLAQVGRAIVCYSFYHLNEVTLIHVGSIANVNPEFSHRYL